MTPEVCLKRYVEELNENATHIAPHPVLEDIDEKSAVLLTAYRTFSHEVASLRIKEALAFARPIAPTLIGDIDRLIRGPFYDRNKLQPFCTQFVPEKAIDRPAMVLVGGVNRAQ